MREIDLLQSGGVADGKTDNAQAIQAAINECFTCGGGKVVLKNGTFLSSPFRLKSNVEFYIDETAVLLASPRFEDYREWSVKSADGFLPWNNSRCFILADCEKNVSITGKGKIDCNGDKFIIKKFEHKRGWAYDYMDLHEQNIPREIFITGCENVKIEGVTLVSAAACWSYWINDCKNVVVDNCKIFNDVQTPNSDGFHFNCCNGVTVQNCEIVCGDDCIVVRANSSVFNNPVAVKPCENVLVENCKLTSYSAAIRIGWICDGTVKNCSFKNIEITDSSVGVAMVNDYHDENDRTSDQGKEYSFNENLFFENIVMRKVYGRPILYQIEEKSHHKETKNIVFKNVTASGLEYPYLRGTKNIVSEFIFENCRFSLTSDDEQPNYELHGAAAWDRRYGKGLFVAENVDCKMYGIFFEEQNNERKI